MEKPTFASCVSSSLEKWLHLQACPQEWTAAQLGRTKDEFLALAMLLGCPTISSIDVASVVMKAALAGENITEHVFYNPESTFADDEALIVRAWLAIHHAHDPKGKTAWLMESHIIAGILYRDRWKKVIATEEGAYAIATMLLRYTAHRGMLSSRDAVELYSIVKGQLKVALTEWLGPQIVLEGFSIGDLSRALFGDAWTTFMLDEVTTAADIVDKINSTRPPFVEGRLPGGVSIEGRPSHTQELPDLSAGP
jgi:hypothetical protein